MLTRDQVRLMLLMRKRPDSPFSKLPSNIICYLVTELDQKAAPEFTKALDYVACSQLAALKPMLDNNPRLLLYAGSTITNGGKKIIRSTLFECAVYSGNPYAVKMILPYFEKIEKGELIKQHQIESCRPYIKSFKEEIEKFVCSTYDVEKLFELIIESSPQEINAALSKDRNHDGELSRELSIFRAKIADDNKKTKGMHYKHYGTLLTILDLKCMQWRDLTRDQRLLIWRQIIGYLQLFLPTIDRFAFAGGFRKNHHSLNIFGSNGNTFPNAPLNGDSWVGLGFDFAINGDRVDDQPTSLKDAVSETANSWKFHLERKLFLLENLLFSPPRTEPKPESYCPIM